MTKPALTLINDEWQMDQASMKLPWFAETRPKRVKRLGMELTGPAAVGSYDGRVRWLFKHRLDRDAFMALHGTEVICAGWATA